MTEAGCNCILGRQQTAFSHAEESSQLIECLFTHSEFGFATLDAHFRYVRIYSALAKMNGLAAETHVGKTHLASIKSLPEEESSWPPQRTVIVHL
jgi:hypothetical protein